MAPPFNNVISGNDENEDENEEEREEFFDPINDISVENLDEALADEMRLNKDIKDYDCREIRDSSLQTKVNTSESQEGVFYKEIPSIAEKSEPLSERGMAIDNEATIKIHLHDDNDKDTLESSKETIEAAVDEAIIETLLEKEGRGENTGEEQEKEAAIENVKDILKATSKVNPADIQSIVYKSELAEISRRDIEDANQGVGSKITVDVVTSAIDREGNNHIILDDLEWNSTSGSLANNEASVDERSENNINMAEQDLMDLESPVDNNSHPLEENASFEEQRSKCPDYNIEVQASSSVFSGWGGMLSALNNIKTKAASGLDRFLDPVIGEGEDEYKDKSKDEEKNYENNNDEEAERSVKHLFDKLSPERNNVSWMEEIDKGFDYASDRLGQALLGGLKKLESTVGVAIEPISSPDSSPQNDASTLSADEEKTLATPTMHIGKSLYSVGLSTLEKLGKTTAGIMETTRGKLAPLLATASENDCLTRQDLKRSFNDIFHELMGDNALERLQIKSTEASIKLKGKLKTLAPRELLTIQTEIKSIGTKLDALREAKNVDWSFLDGVVNVEQGELVDRLCFSIDRSLRQLENVDDAICKLQSRVDSPFPVDTPTLFIYFMRYSLANILSASLHILLCLEYRIEAEEQIIGIMEMLYGAVSKSQNLIECPLIIKDSRKRVLEKLIADDCAMARSIFGDVAPTLQPLLKLSKYESIKNC